jgi:hypothetical protein
MHNVWWRSHVRFLLKKYATLFTGMFCRMQNNVLMLLLV